ncbi:MAG: 2-oxoacid:acceptor oxidoreductase subunit alpha [Patescibacteria group bacterium]|nr:2-oxoacid:acceptor oxidoreductase subunit alpha [Patescibacteria group bacterium]
MASELITIKIGGEAGFGIKVAGATLSKVFLRAGYEIFDYSEYPSLIRGGHNTFEVTVGPRVRSCVRPVNLLIALNQQTFDQHLPELSSDAGIIFNGVKVKPTSKDFRLFDVPFSELAKNSGGTELVKNTVALGAGLAVLNAGVEGLLMLLKQVFAKKSPQVITMNLNAASAGYDYVKTHFKEPFPYQLKSLPPRDLMYLTGNEAVGLGAIAGGCSAYFAYPMTPSSTVLEYLTKSGPKVGMLVRQPEDEISVLSSAIGSGFAGIRAMVGTSGGGFSLMTESLGLSGMTETPVVIFMAQRPGPATGLPTWTGQADLRFLLHAGQDEFPRMIIAPGDAEECFYFTAEALNFAEKFQLPVFVLSDKNLGEGGMSVPTFDPAKIKIERGEWLKEEDLAKMGQYLRYRLTASGVSPRVLPGCMGGVHEANSDEHDEYGHSDESAKTRTAQMDKRMRKLEAALKEVPDPKLYGPKDAELTIVSWGSTKGAILQALEELLSPPAGGGDKDGVGAVNFLHFTYLWPFPTPNAAQKLLSAKKLLVIENNHSGQFEGLIKEHIGRVPEEHLRKYDGRPFWPHEIVEKIRKHLSN